MFSYSALRNLSKERSPKQKEGQPKPWVKGLRQAPLRCRHLTEDLKLLRQSDTGCLGRNIPGRQTVGAGDPEGDVAGYSRDSRGQCDWSQGRESLHWP